MTQETETEKAYNAAQQEMLEDWLDNECDHMMAQGALEAIRDLLDDGGIPRGTFADDQVRNLVTLYNQRGDRITELEEALA